MFLGIGFSLKYIVNGAEVILSPVEDTLALYSDDFNSYANGTQLTSNTVPVGKRFTRTGASGSTPTVNSVTGELIGDAGIYTEAGTGFLGIDLGSANHWVEREIGTSVTGNTKGVMFAADDHQNCAGFRFHTSNVILREVVAGVASSSLTTLNFNNVSRIIGFRSPVVSAGDIFGVQVFGGRAYIFKNRIRIGSVNGYAITPTGTKFGFTNGNSPWNTATKLEAGPLAGRVSIGNAWYVEGQTPGGFRLAFPRYKDFSVYPDGYRDVIVPITTFGTVTGFVFSLSDPDTGKRLKIKDDEVWMRAQSASSTGVDTYNVTFRIPCGLRNYEDGTTRSGTRPYLLTVAPENDTRGYDTHPSMFYIARGILEVGQSNANLAGIGTPAAIINDFPGCSVTKVTFPSGTDVLMNSSTSWENSTTNGNDLPSAGIGRVLTTKGDLPVMIIGANIIARGADVLDPNAATSDGAYIRLSMQQGGGMFEEILLNQGENEINSASVASALAWSSRWVTNIQNYLGYANQPESVDVRVFVQITAKYPGIGTVATASLLRKAQHDVLAAFDAAGITAYHASHGIGYGIDGSHHYMYGGLTGIFRQGWRVGLSLAYADGDVPFDGRGPLADTANITRVGAVITIPVLLNGADSLTSLNGDGTDAAANSSLLTGWHVSDSFNSSTGVFTGDRTVGSGITSVVLSGSNIVITLASDPGGSVVVHNYSDVTPDVSSRVFGVYSDVDLGAFNIGMWPIINPLTVV